MSRTLGTTLVIPRDEANARLPQDAPRHDGDVPVRFELLPRVAPAGGAASPLASAIEQAEEIGAAYTDRLRAWLAEDERNLRAFAHDPMGTLRTAPLGVDAGTLDRLAALAASITPSARTN